MAWNGSENAPIRVQRPAERGTFSAWAWGALGLTVALIAGGAWYFLSGTEDGKAVETVVGNRKLKGAGVKSWLSPTEAVRRAMPSGAQLPQRKRRRAMRPEELFSHLKGEDLKLAQSVQSALDADDFQSTLHAATDALKSKNPEVRQNAIEALGWFGAPALPELTGCLADADEDVRQVAENHWEQAVQEIEDPSQQFAIAAAAFGTLSDPDQLTTIGGILSNAATECIDSEENADQAAENRVVVLQALVDIIESGRPQNVEAAKEAYNDITGNEWMGLDEAERYLSDPDNYDPDERPEVSEQSEARDDEVDESQVKERKETP